MDDPRIDLYRRMAELTKPECEQCLAPFSCCDSMGCKVTQIWAKEAWGIDLEPVPEADRPTPTRNTMRPEWHAFFIKKDVGCVVAPHLRPHCARHTCAINSLGVKYGDPDWTKQYFDLLKLCDQAEADAHRVKKESA